MAETETFWTRLEAHMGDHTIASLERAAGLGQTTLKKGKARGSTPTAEVGAAVAAALGLAPEVLYGPDLPDVLQRAETPAAEAATRHLPLHQINLSALNPRKTIDEDAIAELAESIVAKGLLQNLVVRQKPGSPGYVVVAGERRFRALTRLASAGNLPADLATPGIPCRVVQVTDEDHVILALMENMQRQNVNPLEEAEAIARLHATNPKKWSTRVIAEKLGVTQRQIQLRLQLAEKLSDDAKEKLREGEITLAQAKVLATRPQTEQGDLLQDALAGHNEHSLADLASENMMVAEYALFDIAKSGLETWQSPAGVLFICDFEAAMAEQAKIVKAKRAELLKNGRPWVDELPYPQTHLYKPGGQGAVIVLDQHTGEVTISTDLDRVTTRAAPARAPVDDHFYKGRLRYNEEHRKATDELLADIREQLTFREARALLLWDAFAPDGTILHDTLIGPPSAKVLQNLVRGSGLEACDNSEEKKLRNAWAHLTEIADGYANNAIAAFVGERLIRPCQCEFPLVLKLLVAAQKLRVAPSSILFDSPKLREARIKAYMEEVEGQTDLEDAIAERAA